MLRVYTVLKLSRIADHVSFVAITASYSSIHMCCVIRTARERLLEDRERCVGERERIMGERERLMGEKERRMAEKGLEQVYNIYSF